MATRLDAVALLGPTCLTWGRIAGAGSVAGGAAPGRGRVGLVRQSGATSVAAAVGLLSGLLLDVTIAAIFGAGQATDSWFVGARIPVAIATLLLVGANQALVPVVGTWDVAAGQAETDRRVSRLLAVVLLWSGVLGLLLAGIAPLVVAATAPGLTSAQSSTATDVLRLVALTVPLTAAGEVLPRGPQRPALVRRPGAGQPGPQRRRRRHPAGVPAPRRPHRRRWRTSPARWPACCSWSARPVAAASGGGSPSPAPTSTPGSPSACLPVPARAPGWSRGCGWWSRPSRRSCPPGRSRSSITPTGSSRGRAAPCSSAASSWRWSPA